MCTVQGGGEGVGRGWRLHGEKGTHLKSDLVNYFAYVIKSYY